MNDPSSYGAVSAVERRSEPRASAVGEALLRPYNQSLLKGELIDLSPAGMRLRYIGKRMRVGSQVEVLAPWQNAKATVAWTIRSGEWIQVGLRLVEKSELVAEEVVNEELENRWNRA